MKISETVEKIKRISLDESDLEALILANLKKEGYIPKGAQVTIEFNTSQGCFSSCSVRITTRESS